MSEGADLSLTCRCGSFRARMIGVSPKTGSHLMCYCKDCQAFARFLGAEEILKPRGGSDIFHTIPARFEIEQGQQHLACLRLSPKGTLRWYASCCDTPICNTLSGKWLEFLGVLTPTLVGDDVGEALGPVIAVVNVDSAQPGPGTLRNRGFARAAWAVIRRHFGAKLSGRGGQTPFFGMEGTPVVVPRVLTLEERRAATPE